MWKIIKSDRKKYEESGQQKTQKEKKSKTAKKKPQSTNMHDWYTSLCHISGGGDEKS